MLWEVFLDHDEELIDITDTRLVKATSMQDRWCEEVDKVVEFGLK